MRSIKVNKLELERLYLAEKLSDDKIGVIFGVSGGTISYYRKKYGINKIECWQRLNVPKKLSNKETDVVLGHLLGDGCLRKNSKYPALRVSQCRKQTNFVLQLHSLLKRWAAYTPVEDDYYSKRYKKRYQTCRFDTVAHPVFVPFYDLCYDKKVKIVNEEWLDKISPLGLSVWYQGDGTLQRTTPIFKTNSFTEDQHKLLVFWFYKKFGIKAHYRLDHKIYFNLCIDDGMAFRELIEPHIIPSFRYKLPIQS